MYFVGLSVVGKGRGCNTGRTIEATLLLHKGIWLYMPPAVLIRNYKNESVREVRNTTELQI